MKGIRVWLSAAVLSIACPTLSLSAGQGDGPGDGPGVPDRRQRVAREREVRQQRFSARIDSLVSSGEFQFLPVSMMWSPRMQSQIIDGYYYYVGIFKEQLQVHMPVVVGRALTYNAIANFDTDSLSGYRNEKNDTGWKVSFSAEDETGTTYAFVFTIYRVTGRAVLDMISDSNLIQYTGTIVANDAMPRRLPVGSECEHTCGRCLRGTGRRPA